jgi:AP2-associated kinase
MPQRSHSPSGDNVRTTFNSSNQRSQDLSSATEDKGSIGAFWSTQHAQELAFVDDKWSAFDKEQATSKQAQDKIQNTPANTAYRKSLSASVDSSPGDYEIRFSPNGSEYGLEKTKTAKIENKTTAQTAAFNSFVVQIDDVNLKVQNNVSSLNMTSKLKEQQLEAEVILLKQQLKIANLEKQEISLKFDRLSSICSSQRREIQELKKALATDSATPSVELKEHSKVEVSPPSANLDTPVRFAYIMKLRLTLFSIVARFIFFISDPINQVKYSSQF